LDLLKLKTENSISKFLENSQGQENKEPNKPQDKFLSKRFEIESFSSRNRIFQAIGPNIVHWILLSTETTKQYNTVVVEQIAKSINLFKEIIRCTEGTNELDWESIAVATCVSEGIPREFFGDRLNMDYIHIVKKFQVNIEHNPTPLDFIDSLLQEDSEFVKQTCLMAVMARLLDPTPNDSQIIALSCVIIARIMNGTSSGNLSSLNQTMVEEVKRVQNAVMRVLTTK